MGRSRTGAPGASQARGLVVLIVADTSPLNYLIRIGAIDLLPRLYARVAIPLEVRNELNVDVAPELVRTWIDNPPEWLTICSVDPVLHDDLRWSSLDAGEKAAIALASSNRPAIILLDER